MPPKGGAELGATYAAAPAKGADVTLGVNVTTDKPTDSPYIWDPAPLPDRGVLLGPLRQGCGLNRGHVGSTRYLVKRALTARNNAR